MASIRLNKKTYSRLAMLERELYEMARAKVERTIDPKLWAAMASLCSRTYEADLGEFAKPLGNTKDVLLARYVAGLIIMKQPCASSEADIDRIKALKLYGHKLVDEFNTSIDEIQQLYNENCGNLPKATRNASVSTPEISVDDSEMNDTNITQPVTSDEPADQIRTNHHASDIRDKIGKVEKKSINNIWNNIIDRTEKALEAEKQVKKAKERQVRHEPIDISKIDKIKVRRKDGTIDEIYPARIARYAKYMIGQLGQDDDTRDANVLKKYFPKNIIWTFETTTAATDGVRVFFNPVFADMLFSLDNELFNKRLKSNPNLDPETINGRMF
jgi:hypothetical protein